MQTYDAVLLFVSLLLAFTTEVRGEGECQSRHFLVIQEKCRAPNNALLEAEKEHDHLKVCSSLYELWSCVARYVPVCFHKVTELYKVYFHSPHNCVLTVEQLQTLQALTLSSAHQNNNTDGDVDVSVDVVPLSSSSSSSSASSTATTTTTTATFLHSSTSSSSLVTSAEGGDEGEGGVNVTSVSAGPDGEHGNTTRHKHTGSGAPSHCHCTVTMVTVSWLLAWLLTSSFPHS